MAGADLNKRIETNTTRVDALRAAIATETRKIRSSAPALAAAHRRLRTLQADNARQQARLRTINSDLTRTRSRLTRLIGRQRAATDALRANLVAVPAYTITRSIAITQATPRSIGLPGDHVVLTTMRELHGAGSQDDQPREDRLAGAKAGDHQPPVTLEPGLGCWSPPRR